MEIEVISLIIHNTVRNTEKDMNSSHCPPWLDLPKDLWYSIMDYLNLADQIRLLLVCKFFSSKLSLQHKNPINRLPWLLKFEISKTDGFTCKLFDPIHDNQHPPYQIYRIEKFCPDYYFSKHGWLFFLKEERSHCCLKSITETLLFCPYSKEIILLPELHFNLPDEFVKLCFGMDDVYNFCSSSHRMPTATFSMSNPHSEQCVFFVVYYYFDIQKLIVSSCQKKDEKWRTYEFIVPRDQISSSTITSAVYHQEKLYLLMESRQKLLAVIYNHDNKTFGILNNPFIPFDLRFFTSFQKLIILEGSLHFIVSNLKLTQRKPKLRQRDAPELTLREFGGHDEELSEFHEFHFCYSNLFKWKNNSAVEEKSITNQALFFSYAYWDSAFAIEDLIGDELEFLGNKVIYSENCMNFFDLSERSHQIQNKYFVAGKAEGKGFIRKRSERMAWIEPPNHVNEFVKFSCRN